MYAQLCKRLTEEAPNFETGNTPCTFRLLLLNKCRDEFENRSKIAEAFDKRDGPLAPEDEERRQLAKRKMLGNIKFIGELGKLEILHESILHKCCQQLLEKKKRRGAKDEAEDLECLCQIMRTCGRILDSEKGKTLMNQYFDRMATLAESHELPLRIRFMLRDAIELRRNRWVPRKATNMEGPMPIQQIRNEENHDRGYMGNMHGGHGHGHGHGHGGRSGGGDRGDRGGMQDFFRSPLQTRGGMSDMLGSLSLGSGNPQGNQGQDKFGYNSNGYQSSGFRNQRHGGYGGGGGGGGGDRGGQQNFYPNQNRQNFNNKQQQQQQNFNNQGGSNKEIAPRFMHKMMQGQVNMEELSLRPAANSMMFKKNANLPKPPLGMNTGRQNDLLMQPAQTSLLNKNAPPIMHKESPILIKQGSLDKNKAAKNKGPSKEEVLKKVDSMMEEYLTSSNTQDAISFYKEQKVPDRFVAEVLLAVMNKSLDKGDTERDLVSSFMSVLKKEVLITSAQFLEALKELVNQMAEKEQEIPRIFSHVAGFAAHAVLEELVALAEVAELTEHGAHYPLFMLVLQQLHKSQPGKPGLSKLFTESKVNLLHMLPEGDRTKERLAEILEDRDLGFLLPLLRIQAELWKQLQSDPNPTQFYKWIKENLDPSHYGNPGFINALVTVLIKYITQESTLAEGVDTTCPPDKVLQEKEQALLERYKLVLQSFLHEKVDLQVVAVYALQVFCHALQFPKGMLLRWFHNLYDLEVIEEEAFMKWKEDISDDYPGKGNALFQVNQWLTWLAEAEYEEEEEEEDADN